MLQNDGEDSADLKCLVKNKLYSDIKICHSN